MSVLTTEIFASAAVTAAGNTAAFSVPTSNHLLVGIDITAWGTAGPLFFFQVTDDDGTTWYDHPIELQMTTLASGAAGTATANSVSYQSTIIGKVLFIFKNLAAKKFRLRWTVASGSATFSASAVAK
jgi:hypothetical protein